MALHSNVEHFQPLGAKPHPLLWENTCSSTGMTAARSLRSNMHHVVTTSVTPVRCWPQPSSRLKTIHWRSVHVALPLIPTKVHLSQRSRDPAEKPPINHRLSGHHATDCQTQRQKPNIHVSSGMGCTLAHRSNELTQHTCPTLIDCLAADPLYAVSPSQTQHLLFRRHTQLQPSTSVLQSNVSCYGVNE